MQSVTTCYARSGSAAAASGQVAHKEADARTDGPSDVNCCHSLNRERESARKGGEPVWPSGRALSPFLIGQMFVREPSWKYSANLVGS